MKGVHSEGFTNSGAAFSAKRNPRSSPRVSVPSGWVDRARNAFSRASSFEARYLLDRILTHPETLWMPQWPSILKLEDSMGSA